MKRSLGSLALVGWMLCLSVGTVHAQNTVVYLPQVANGSFAGGSFRTTFLVFNPNSTEVTVDIVLTDSVGAPMLVTIPGLGTGSTFNLVLPPGGGRILKTDGTGTLLTGAATVTANTLAPLGISAIFTLFDGSGKFLTESGVGSSVPQLEFGLPVDAGGVFNTGLALFNVNSFDANVRLLLLDEQGVEVGRADFVLPGGHHRANFVAGEFFSGVSKLRGTLRVTSSARVAAVTLRQNESPISFTTLPVVSGAAPQTFFLLPHVANGRFEGGAFQTTFIVFNPFQSRAQVSIRLTQDDGTPLPVTLGDLGTNSTFNIELEPGQAFFGQTDGSGELLAGAATVTSTQPVGVSSIFTVLDASNNFVTEAGVGDSPALSSFSIPVDFAANSNTGVAFFSNPPSPAAAGSEASPQAAEPVTLTLQLRNQQGSAVGLPVSLQLQPGQHAAKFITEMVPGIRAFRGTLAVTSSGEVSAVALRQNGDPLVYATLPSVVGAFDPAQPAALTPLSQRVDVDGTADRVVNVQLPGGFRLAGTVNGATTTGDSAPLAWDGPLSSGPSLLRVRAVSNTGRLFGGRVASGDRHGYSMALPAGLYQLNFCYQPDGEINLSAPTLTFDVPGTVQIQADTTRDFIVPTAELFTISGAVSNLEKLPAESGILLVLTSTDERTQGSFPLAADGSYSGSLPNGTYQVSLRQDARVDGTSVQVRILDMGTVVIAGADQTAGFEVPDLVKLSGKVGADNMAIPEISIVSATQLGGTVRRGCVRAPRTSSGDVNPSTGDYEIFLEKGVEFDLDVTFVILDGGRLEAFLIFGFLRTVMDSDKTVDFNLGALPTERRITGKVTGPDGSPVAGASVTTSQNGVTGLPGVLYLGFATSNQEGNYELSIPDAAEVGISFSPPSP